MLLAFCRQVTGHAWLTLFGVVLLTGFAVERLIDFEAISDGRLQDVVRLEIDPSLDSLIPVGDPDKIFYDEVRSTLGINEALVLVAHRDEGIYEQRFLASLLRTAERLESHEAVDAILALPSAPNIRGVDGSLDVGSFYENPPGDQAEIQRIRTQLSANPSYAGSLVSHDETSTAIVIYLFDIPPKDFTRQNIDRQLEAIALEEFGDSAEIWLTGGPRIKADTTRAMIADLRVIVPLAFLVCSIIAFIFYRTLRGVFVPILTITFGLIWTLTMIAMTDPRINIVTVALPALILVIGFCYAVHVVSSYYEAIEEAKDFEAPDGSAALRGMQRIVLPTLLTGATTAAGFFSLGVSRLDAVRLFGLHCGFGVLCTMVAALTLAPALLQVLPERGPRAGRGRAVANYSERLFELLGNFVLGNRTRILWAGAAVALLCLALLPQIVVSTNLARNFADDTGVKRAIHAAKQYLGSVDQIYVVLETPTPDGVIQPAVLRLIEAIQQQVNAQPEVEGSTSLADYVKQLNRAFNDNDPDAYRIPESAELISQLILISSTDELDRITDSQRQLASMAVRINVTDSVQVKGLAERLDHVLAGLPHGVTGRVTGNPVLLARTSDEISYGQALSLSTAFVIIFAILSLLFMSFRVGFQALIPNVLPVGVYFGALAVTGVTLNIMTGSIACIVLGIAVDDTIHFLTRFNEIAKREADERLGMLKTLLEVGPPVTVTTVGLCLGFSILGFAELQSLVDFGLLAAFTLAVAWLVDVTFTPALAMEMRIVTLWDVVALDLGKRAEQAIPLLRGLRPAQSKIAVLMLTLREFPAGHQLIRAGEKEDGMYVILEGQLHSTLLRDGQRVSLNRHERGDLVGEVGVLKGERTADVECVTDTRLLWLDNETLERLRRRYPRIASVIYRNLSEILAERLTQATWQ
jgi:predicted RND superfamily exporter protein